MKATGHETAYLTVDARSPMRRRPPSGRAAASFGFLITAFFVLLGCGCCTWSLDVIDHTPIAGGDWEVSTPEATGLDPALIDELYCSAAKLETTLSVLVVKDGFLVAERYFNGGAPEQKHNLASVTKSFNSALVGIAIDQGYIEGVEQRMMEFFPELSGEITDVRKDTITVGQLLQMRAGFPWEESSEELFTMLYSGFRPSYLAAVPLVRNPGAGMEYSNLTSHILGLIVSRATGEDLLDFAQTNLFSPLDIDPGDWITDLEGNRNGHADLQLRPRDLAKFGQLYLDGGNYNGTQIVQSDWVHASLAEYSYDAWPFRIGRNFNNIRYGYQWWTVRAGDHDYDLAWGHGGQQIALVPELNMVVVVTADPLYRQHGSGPWKRERANLNLVADFIRSLP